jgi:hypothetical protein
VFCLFSSSVLSLLPVFFCSPSAAEKFAIKLIPLIIRYEVAGLIGLIKCCCFYRDDTNHYHLPTYTDIPLLSRLFLVVFSFLLLLISWCLSLSERDSPFLILFHFIPIRF